ncbi:hypothetical protein J6590_104551, partial [Homalodisca vitripennis]
LHEIAYYDLPAMVEHISRSTDHDRIFYSGYSVGGTLFLMMTAARPEYNRKFLGAFLLAPLLVRPDSTELSPVFRMGFEFIFAFVRVLKDYQVGEFYPRQAEMLRMKEEACKASAQTFPLCVRMLYKPFGLRPSQYDVAAKKLPCLFCDCMGNREGFSHFGYVISSYASQYVFRKVVRSMMLLETEVGRDLACS